MNRPAGTRRQQQLRTPHTDCHSHPGRGQLQPLLEVVLRVLLVVLTHSCRVRYIVLSELERLSRCIPEDVDLCRAASSMEVQMQCRQCNHPLLAELPSMPGVWHSTVLRELDLQIVVTPCTVTTNSLVAGRPCLASPQAATTTRPNLHAVCQAASFCATRLTATYWSR